MTGSGAETSEVAVLVEAEGVLLLPLLLLSLLLLPFAATSAWPTPARQLSQKTRRMRRRKGAVVPKTTKASSEDETPGRNSALSWRARAALVSGDPVSPASVSRDVLLCQAIWQMMFVRLKSLCGSVSPGVSRAVVCAVALVQNQAASCLFVDGHWSPVGRDRDERWWWWWVIRTRE